jgi:hypothetical protein
MFLIVYPMICAWTSYSDIIWRKISESRRSKKYIFEKTLMVPAIYENGTLFATNQKLTLEMLKEISDSADVLEVAGDYTGNITARGSSHVHSDDCPLRDLDYAY